MANQLTQQGFRHPWERARFRFFDRVLRRGWKNGDRVLDVGAGDGWFAEQLLLNHWVVSRVVCWDSGYSDASFAVKEGARLERTASQPTEKFEKILLLDVLEHVDGDAAFLKGIVEQNLAPRGEVLISVPAWQPLFSAHDRFLRHFRRYSFEQLRVLVRSADLEVVASGGLFHSLLLPRALSVVRERLFRRTGPEVGLASWNHGPLVTGLIGFALAIDNLFSFLFSRWGWQVPGLSGWVRCRKRGE